MELSVLIIGIIFILSGAITFITSFFIASNETKKDNIVIEVKEVADRDGKEFEVASIS